MRYRSLTLVLGLCLSLSLNPAPAAAQPNQPASALEAAQVIDLSQLAPIDPTEDPVTAVVASLSYKARGDVTQVAKKWQEKLKASGWKELDGAAITDAYASCSWSKAGFTLSMTVTPGADQTVDVSLINHGNLDLASIRLPAGSKDIAQLPQMRMAQIPAPQDQVSQQLREQLLADGWAPFGETSVSFFVKKNAIRLQVMATPAPNDPQGTFLQLAPELLSADLPAPPEATGLQYSDVTRQMTFDSSQNTSFWIDYFRKELGASGWEPTTENPIKIDFQEVMIFRNPAGDLFEVSFTKVDDLTRIMAKFRTAKEVEAEEQRARERLNQKR